MYNANRRTKTGEAWEQGYIKGAIKVLGTWLTRDMISDVVVDENIQKARRAFFALGSTGLFQGRLNL